MTTGTVRILRKPASSPNTSGRATLRKKASAAVVKLITLNERGWKFQNDILTLRTAIVFCLKRHMGRLRIDRIKLFSCMSDFATPFEVSRVWNYSLPF
ncbi:hypothetical protein AVEN_2108-1 [Araneus ventricosus]|uniref:Uncharacterized protein n=1 Tax=Araneus ventricosus TaxID=182803 RepID=A0A4Y2JSP0_ARAVE|nr:hypothetical protein AVEN_2108-1 [Araneus ventricosus]